VPEDFLVRVDACVSVEELESLWNEAVAGGFADAVKEVIKNRKAKL
jgi:hypothetical protein